MLVLLLIAVAALVVWAALAWRTGRFRAVPAGDLLSHPPGSRALVIAFTTPDCAPCRMRQRPALEYLHRAHPRDVDIREVDATVEPGLAERFGILSVPSTVVIDRRGTVLAINHTLAPAARLASQLGLNGTRP